MTSGLQLLDEGSDKGFIEKIDFIGSQVIANVLPEQDGKVRVIKIYGSVPEQDMAYATVSGNQIFKFNQTNTNHSILTFVTSLGENNAFTYDQSTGRLTFENTGLYMFNLSVKGTYQDKALCHDDFRKVPQIYNFAPTLWDGVINKTSQIQNYSKNGKYAWCNEGSGKGGNNNVISGNYFGYVNASAGWEFEIFAIVTIFSPFHPGLAPDAQMSFSIRQLRKYYYD